MFFIWNTTLKREIVNAAKIHSFNNCFTIQKLSKKPVGKNLKFLDFLKQILPFGCKRSQKNIVPKFSVTIKNFSCVIRNIVTLTQLASIQFFCCFSVSKNSFKWLQKLKKEFCRF